MPKYMNMRNRYLSSKLDLKLFAEGGGDGAGDDAGDGDDQDDDQDDSDADEGGDDKPKYTQADLDKAVARTIAKERRKAERAAKKKEQQAKDSSSGDDGESEDTKARKEAEGKASRLEVKVACFEADVAKDAVDDVAALAHAYMEADDSLDLEEAIEKVVKKYPHFKNKAGASDDDADDSKGKSWGERQRGGSKRMTGVEAAFLKKNPGLKY